MKIGFSKFRFQKAGEAGRIEGWSPVLRFSFDGGAVPGDIPALALPLAGPDAVESWEIPGDVACGHSDGFSIASGEGVLAGTIEADVPAGAMEARARELYGRLFALLDAHGVPHLVRVHNFIPRITEREAGEEVYRAFNTGRFAAFGAWRREAVSAPAATGVGVPDDRFRLSFVATREPGRPVENPRQVPAHAYPRRYGPTSPTFSRATLLGGVLLISGTASIVGHETLHAGDVRRQAEEIGRNLDALTQAAGIRADRALLRLYLRDLGDRVAVEAGLADWLARADAVFLEARLCRDDLLVEAEGVVFAGC